MATGQTFRVTLSVVGLTGKGLVTADDVLKMFVDKFIDDNRKMFDEHHVEIERVVEVFEVIETAST